MISREKLDDERAGLQQTIAQMEQRLTELRGALRFCEFLIGELNEEGSEGSAEIGETVAAAPAL